MSEIRLCAACKNLGEEFSVELGRYLHDRLPDAELRDLPTSTACGPLRLFFWSLIWNKFTLLRTEEIAEALWGAYRYFLEQRLEVRPHQGLVVEVAGSLVKCIFSIGDDVRSLEELTAHLSVLLEAMEAEGILPEKLSMIKGCVVRR